MKLNHILPFALACASLCTAQTPVDRLVAALDSLTTVSFDTWKISPDLKGYRPQDGDPVKPGFDDSRWDDLRIAQSIYVDSCWMRKEITMPPTILGQKTHGPVHIFVSVDDEGTLWVNGELKGKIPWSAEFALTDNAQPGQKFLLAIKAINTGGPLRLLRAEIQADESRETKQAVNNFTLSARVGQKLLGFDTYQTNARKKDDPGIDRSAMERSEKERLNVLLQKLAGSVDVDALRSGNLEQFKASLDAARKQLGPVREFAQRFTLFFDSNAHIDAAWLWRKAETIEVCKNTFSSVLHMMQQRPDFTYTQSSAAYYEWMRTLYPDLFKGIQQQVRDGRWEIVGGMWVEPDCNIPSGESWARHLLYAKRYFQKNFSTDVSIGWNPDSFGYTWNMPMFYRNAGIDAFITQKIGWNDTNVFPHRLFWWESADGSRILSYFPFDYVNTIEDPFDLVDWLRQYEANTGLTKLMILFGVGDHGGGPSLEMLGRIDQLKTLDVYPTIEHGTASAYLGWLRTRDLSRLPVWKDELYLEYHQGTFTTQAAMKESNRKTEVLLTNAEKFSVMANMDGLPYPSLPLQEAWRSLLFNQFHDILPGSGIREVYLDAAEDYTACRQIGSMELTKALRHLARSVRTDQASKGTPIIVFNPLGWERTDVATVPLADGDTSSYAVFNTRGERIPAQSVSKSPYQREILFIANAVPALGYEVYELRRDTTPQPGAPVAAARNMLENAFYNITVDMRTGWISSIVDKRVGEEMLTGAGNRLQLLEDRPTAWDAWNIGWTGVEYPTHFRSAALVEQGPVRSVIRVHHDYLKPGRKKDFPTEDFPTSFFDQDIILYNGLDRIDFETRIDWWEEKTMVKVAFPVTAMDTMATYEIPYGTITRSTRMKTSWEKGKVEVPASRWADLSTSIYGVSLLNTSKYGYDIKGNVMRLSLLRSPNWPDPTADRGKHVIRYSLYSHKGTWSQAHTVQRGYEVNTPLLVLQTDSHKGALPPRHSFFALEPASLILTSIKKAEEGDAYVVQWYNSGSTPVTATLMLPKIPAQVRLTNFLEGEGTPIEVNGTSVLVPTPSRGVVTVKILPEKRTK
jgi:alpha-mannosidase